MSREKELELTDSDKLEKLSSFHLNNLDFKLCRVIWSLSKSETFSEILVICVIGTVGISRKCLSLILMCPYLLKNRKFASISIALLRPGQCMLLWMKSYMNSCKSNMS